MNTKVMEASSARELALRRRIAEQDSLYQHSPNGLAVLDPQFRFLDVNDALSRFQGMPREMMAGRSLWELMPEITGDVAERIASAAQNQQCVHNLELALHNHAGQSTARYFLAHFYPLRPAAGEDHKHTGLVLVDISDRKAAEEALRRSEARYRDTVENSVYGSCLVSSDGTASAANSAMLRILGCGNEVDLGSMNFFRDVFRYPEQQATLFANCRERGRLQNAESEWRRRDGGFVSVRLHLRQLKEHPSEESIEVIAEDVTELRALERQLQQAQKFEAIGQLAGGIAHDFNNVIGAILGWAELGFEQNRENNAVADRFAKIREQGERAAALTRELLAFARRQVLQPRAVDLNSVIDGLVTFLERVIGKDISIEFHCEPLDCIKADPTQVEQVLMNLCINARDAMPSGGRLLIESGMVEVDESYARFYPGVSHGRYAALSVSDSGSGMDSKTVEHIFEPFFTTKEQGKGTGLGLSTVYGIVKQHGGFLHVYSEPGQGSLFRIYFPAVAGSVAQSAKVALPSVGQLRGNETVLVADDHESLREMARQALASLGYRVLSAADGEEALRLCEHVVPDIAVLDVVMPRMGGAEAARRLMETYPSLHIIFTSGYSRDRDQRTAELPQTHYLQKPYSPTNLGRIVREVLNRNKPETGRTAAD